VAEGTVKSWLHRGRVALAIALEDHDSASGGTR
jgi:DNA-directed RNA polymerase specialized sigma24 family protein